MPNLFPPCAAAKGAAVNRRLADEAYERLYGLVLSLRAEGRSFAAIAAELNARGEKTRVWAAPWNPEQVRRVHARAVRLRGEADPSSPE